MFRIRFRYQLLCIILLASCLRLIFLSSGEIAGDEPAYMVRSIGMIDSLASDLQTTPYDWFTAVPWWVRLSFHDHPPLVFLFQHLFLSVFGVSVFVMRLPSALLGILSVGLLGLIMRQLFTARSALIAMILFAFNSLAVFYARTAMMESITLFFILLTLYFFLRAREQPRYFVAWGISLGLSVIAKYVALAMVPVYALFLINEKHIYRQKTFWIGILGFLLIISPVFIYNIEMYQSRHHFDLQWASLLHQDIKPDWLFLSGKEERGSILHRLAGLSNFGSIFSPVFFAISLAGLASMIFLTAKCWIKNKYVPLGQKVLLLSTGCLLAMTLSFGSAIRFLFYVVPFLCAISAVFIDELMAIFKPRIVWIIFLIFCLYELLFTVNSVLWGGQAKPFGPRLLAYAPSLIVPNNGVQALDKLLENLLQDKVSVFKPTTKSADLNKKMNAYAQAHPREGKKASVILLYDPRLEIRFLLWSLARRTFYEAWPIMVMTNLSAQLSNLYGVDPDMNFYYIHTMPAALRNPDSRFDGLHPDVLAKKIQNQGISYHPVLNRNNEELFQIYTFTARQAMEIVTTTPK
ncbi:MAG: hypothetical protein A2821_00865 [Candidatus Magasanikbacteria bacterium RIFCSPHIGHO2_01_FULL_41_23]|uniref:Glycosyltransferase RgtA/B/C/D-like domain-containing protein n=1 Tax=Candidatus Magasanikbacteria bacterium RIFCSPLOWO2_01_FULL_40_15 TaxID=1798686 RepID=A0A1F6N150_9BACT|nr:MAG: hypothetical protein A2821_00865 [Candidatus Magasanikbacteria bacterium RIFCSPHIGHO2_01_FULL_41_23]OGH74726.1 MAG: hypothetical protein A3F22_02220 [Candidatus Magasanikbacteria bacterium RIFCSPHIGHO2_12_FULL_41_16]OGH77440.1 MAG: hypothetical protein A2983_01920 [Candidatus Magasanikbacteria bacterium RIFCSPLOWO2_01_FULL_40_15]